ncbi:protein-tyrosine-phosphatase [Rodentibacter genomosp. 1]|uniref:Protein-tyrosine-phosphatase n=1 Tax=Rodentibacter genomosp. 1 TaxID=1908264 RepID=A0A1V3J3R7_9PAST|nr:tyrosine-protein phosphatase [Rodentibacter genomosp. 1]OOF49663.1 protein-tyrosine-phosphatase [Rodentibacter genomosp. 1]
MTANLQQQAQLRTLSIEGMNNFRDMGGYLTRDHRKVKWQRLYRSDHLYNASENGIAMLKPLNIQAVIDYRSPNEIAKYPNKIIGTEQIYQFDPNAHTAELAAQFTSSKENEDENLVNKIIEQKQNGSLVHYDDIVMRQYKNFVEKPECQQAFASMLKVAANLKGGAFIQHCRGGKDRTGFGAMLLLGVLGVDKNQIIDDYMLTHINRLERNRQKMAVYRQITQDQEVLNYLYSLIDTKPEFIEMSINTIERQYGSIQYYAEQLLGISRAEILQLQADYLE